MPFPYIPIPEYPPAYIPSTGTQMFPDDPRSIILLVEQKIANSIIQIDRTAEVIDLLILSLIKQGDLDAVKVSRDLQMTLESAKTDIIDGLISARQQFHD